MYKETLRPAWVEIDLDALRFNIRNIRAAVRQQAILIGVVKADAYGHGSVACAKVLEQEGVRHFAVATIQEGIELREAGIKGPVIILGLTPDELADEIVQYDLTPVIATSSDAEVLSEAALRAEKRLDVLIAVDTGMGRIGFCVGTREDRVRTAEEVRKIDELEGLRVVGLISHFATSDEADRTYTRRQLQLFNDLYEELSEVGVSLPWRTIANSAAVMEYPEAGFDVVRPGIVLYGCYPSAEVHPEKLPLRPVMSVKAHITFVKTIPAGAAVSYGRAFVAERETRVATIGIGYADGYSRLLTGKAEVLIRGKRVPVIGRICMDQCMLDVTDVPEVEAGEEVVILGASGEDAVTAEELADKMGTINYEILCGFGMRLPKVYLNQETSV